MKKGSYPCSWFMHVRCLYHTSEICSGSVSCVTPLQFLFFTPMSGCMTL
jgi:hypothetical protein